MSKVTEITSSAHFKTITSSSTYTIVDFYADWCGPCKVISPIFEQLAAAESKPGRLVFCKVNVDNQRDVAGTYGISAMPTFLILKGSSVKETIRGANATALRTAVLSAAADAVKAPARTSAGGFTGKGQTLGSTSSGSAGSSRPVSAPVVPDLSGLLSSPAHFAQGRGLPQTIVRFLGLYFSTLFSLEPVKTAEESPFAVRQAQGARVQKPPLDTDWTYQVGTDPWPEHPRPQFQRSQWQSLNGIWTYEDAGSLDAVNEPPFNKTLHAEVLVPSCLESGLSGIQGNDTLYSWFQTTFEIPSNWTGNRVLLNFAAVDYEATVFVNGEHVAFHRGGYFAFTVDITENLIVGPNSLLLFVHDPTDSDDYVIPIGKQALRPSHIFYRPCSGIWQSVWIESVPAVYISNLDITGDMYGNVNVTVSSESHQQVSISVIERGSGDVIGTGIGSTNEYFSFAVHSPRLWSPDSPTLYDLIVTLDEDTVQSYTGFRSITRQVVDGVQRPLLNGEFHFLFGTLDQGFWPDGLYVPPNREAMEYDIKTLKSLGMNMLRKHASLPPTSICSSSAKTVQQIKIESALYYHSCDELGILVMQDMPSLRPQDNPTPTPAQQDEFNRQLALMVTQLRSHPSIFAWTIYNEGWGQLNDSASQPALDRDLTATLHSLDPTRLVDTVSGWHDHGAGDLRDNHNYPHPMCGVPHTAPSPSGPNDPSRIGFQGEFGGLGQNLSLEHLWDVGQAIAEVNATYRLYETTEAWNQASLDLIGELGRQAARSSCSGGVWTQTTDVEGEVNGVLSYDRRILRADVRRWREGIGALDHRTE